MKHYNSSLSINRSNRQPVFLPNGKVTGNIIDGEFIKTVCSSKHFLRKPPAIAFDESVIEEIQKQNVAKLVIKDRESNHTYTLTLEAFLSKSFSLNRGFGVQLACLLKDWNVTKKQEFHQLELI
jgi:hypothetical protein